jgi:hypothetical protein
MNHDTGSVRNNFEFLKILSVLSSTGKLHVLFSDALCFSTKWRESIQRDRECASGNEMN